MDNCRLKKVQFKDAQNRYLWGFVLMARSKIVEFYTLTIEERDLWIEKLKGFAIILDVKDDYKIG